MVVDLGLKTPGAGKKPLDQSKWIKATSYFHNHAVPDLSIIRWCQQDRKMDPYYTTNRNPHLIDHLAFTTSA